MLTKSCLQDLEARGSRAQSTWMLSGLNSTLSDTNLSECLYNRSLWLGSESVLLFFFTAYEYICAAAVSTAQKYSWGAYQNPNHWRDTCYHGNEIYFCITHCWHNNERQCPQVLLRWTASAANNLRNVRSSLHNVRTDRHIYKCIYKYSEILNRLQSLALLRSLVLTTQQL